VTELKNLVGQYIRERGNADASEVLNDYVKYLHAHGYVIRHNYRTNAESSQLTSSQKALVVHLEA
jgi:glutamate synthase domain-containing protein 3